MSKTRHRDTSLAQPQAPLVEEGRATVLIYRLEDSSLVEPRRVGDHPWDINLNTLFSGAYFTAQIEKVPLSGFAGLASFGTQHWASDDRGGHQLTLMVDAHAAIKSRISAALDTRAGGDLVSPATTPLIDERTEGKGALWFAAFRVNSFEHTRKLCYDFVESATIAARKPMLSKEELVYESEAANLEAEIKAFRTRLIADFLPHFKAAIHSKNWSTYDDKKNVIHWMNTELKRFNLDIKSPKTGTPAKLKAKPGHDPEIGAFELKADDKDGKAKSFITTDLNSLLDVLELMDAPPRREALSEWRERVAKQDAPPRLG